MGFHKGGSFMGYSTQASDWQVAGAAQVGAAAGVGGGGWMFVFQSRAANYSASFLFAGFGLGAGGSMGGASMPDLSSGGMSWSSIRCDQAFSGEDLNYSAGRLTTAGAGLAVGYGFVYISAFNWSGSLFSSQSVGGFSIGVGASAITTAGVWKWMSTGNMRR